MICAKTICLEKLAQIDLCNDEVSNGQLEIHYKIFEGLQMFTQFIFSVI